MTLNFPDTPGNGEKYLAENGIEYTYNLANDTWTGALSAQNVPINPSPSDVSVDPPFGNPSGTNPGSGTLADPFIITDSIVPTLNGSTQSLQTITITSGKAGDQVVFTNNTTPLDISSKYTQPLGYIDANGKWIGKLVYNDSFGADTTANTTYTGKLQCGTGTVYFQWNVQQQATPAMFVTAGTALTGTPVSGTDLGATQPTVSGGLSPYTYSYKWQTSNDNIAFTDIPSAITSSYSLTSANVGKYIRCIATVSDSSTIQAVTVSSTTATVNVVSIDVSLSTNQPQANQPIQASAVVLGGVAPVTTAYQWKADGVNIIGATSATYVVEVATNGKRLSCQITTTDGDNTNAVKTSTQTNPVASGDVPEINTVTLAEVTPDSPDRYTDQSFTVAVDMTKDQPKSDYAIRGKVLGDLTVDVETSVITKLEEQAVDGSWNSSTGAAVDSCDWRGTAYGDGKFVTVGRDTSNKVMYSADGISGWTLSTTPGATPWSSVASNGSRFVAVSDSSGATPIIYSDDGINWTSVTLDTALANPQWSRVVYGNGKFVAVSQSVSDAAVMYSTDGITWAAGTGASTIAWTDVVYGDGKFVAIASSGTNRSMYSTDGISWTMSATAGDSTEWNCIGYGDGKYIALSLNAGMYSLDGINWITTTVPPDVTWRSVTYGVGSYVAVGTTGTQRAMYSADGISWTLSTPSNGDSSWNNIIYADGKFVAVAYNGTGRVMWSYTGTGAAGTEEVLTLTDTTGLSSINQGDTVIQNSGGTPVTSAITNVANANYASTVVAEVGFNSNRGPDKGFDGNTQATGSPTYCQSSTSNRYVQWNASTYGISTATSTLRIWCISSGDDISCTGSTGTITIDATDNVNGNVVPDVGNLTSIRVNNPAGLGGFSGISVDGVLLIDGITTLTLTDDTNLANFRVGDLVNNQTSGPWLGCVKEVSSNTSSYDSGSDYVNFRDGLTYAVTPNNMLIIDMEALGPCKLTFTKVPNSGTYGFMNYNLNTPTETGMGTVINYPDGLGGTTPWVDTFTIPQEGITYGPYLRVYGEGGGVFSYTVSGTATGEPAISVTAINETTPSITTDGGSWSATNGTGDAAWNQSQIWSNSLTKITVAGGSSLGVPTDAFNGTIWDMSSPTNSGYQSDDIGSSITFAPTPGTLVGQIVKLYQRNRPSDVTVNGITATYTTDGNTRICTVDLGSSQNITSVITSATTDDQTNSFSYIKVDNRLLVDTGITSGAPETFVTGPTQAAATGTVKLAGAREVDAAIQTSTITNVNAVAGITTQVPVGTTGDWDGILGVNPDGSTSGPVAIFPDGQGANSPKGYIHYVNMNIGQTITLFGTASGSSNRAVYGAVQETSVNDFNTNLTVITVTTSATSGRFKIDFNQGANVYGITPGPGKTVLTLTDDTDLALFTPGDVVQPADGITIFVNKDRTDTKAALKKGPTYRMNINDLPTGSTEYTIDELFGGMPADAYLGNAVEIWGYPDIDGSVADTRGSYNFTETKTAAEWYIQFSNATAYYYVSIAVMWSGYPSDDTDIGKVGPNVTVTSTNLSTPSITTDGGSWLGTNGTGDTGDGRYEPSQEWSVNSTDISNGVNGFDGVDNTFASAAATTNGYFTFASAVPSVTTVVFYNTNGAASWEDGTSFYVTDSNGVEYQTSNALNLTSISLSVPNKNIVKVGAKTTQSATNFQIWTSVSMNGKELINTSRPGAAGETKVTGPVKTTEVAGPYLTLSSSSGRWLVTETGYSALLKLNKFAKSSSVQSVASLFTVMDGLGNVTDLTTEDPGYTNMVGDPTYTLTFPSVFPSGETPDVELPPGTKYQVEVKATNDVGVDNAFSNDVMPVNADPVNAVMYGLRFDSERVTSLTESPNSALSTWSMSFWVKPSGIGSQNTIFENGVTGSSKYSIAIYNNQLVEFIGNDSTNVIDTNVTDNQWCSYVVSNDDTARKWYKNGAEIASVSSFTLVQETFGIGYSVASPTGTSASNVAFDGYLSEFYTVDGQALLPTVFGQDIEGKWAPLNSPVIKAGIDAAKVAAFPDANTSQSWNTTLSSSSSAVVAAPNAFDALLTTFATTIAEDISVNPAVITFTPATPITVATSLRFWTYDYEQFEKDGGVAYANQTFSVNGASPTNYQGASGTGQYRWVDTGFTGTLNTLTWSQLKNATSPGTIEIAAIEVDGEILLDPGFGANGFYLPFNPAATGVNYSSLVTSTSAYVAGSSAAAMFNGIAAAGSQNRAETTAPGTVTFTSPVQQSGNLRLFMACGARGTAPSGNFDLKLDGVSVFDNASFPNNTSAWVDFGAKTWTILSFGSESGGDWIGIAAIEVDGSILIDHNSIGVDDSGNENNFLDQNFAVGNTSQVWTNKCSTTATIVTDFAGLSSMFDGNPNTYGGIYLGTLDISGLNVTGSSITFKVVAASSSAWEIKVNGTSIATGTQPQDVVTGAISGGTLASIQLINTSDDPTKGTNFATISVDGVLLVDANIQDTVTDTPVKNYATLLTGNNGNLVATGTSSITYLGKAGTNYYYEDNSVGAVHTGGATFASTSGETYNFGQQPFANQYNSSQVWSSMVSGPIRAGFEPANAFNGETLAPQWVPEINDTNVFTPTTPIPFTTLAIWGYVDTGATNVISINGVDCTAKVVEGPKAGTMRRAVVSDVSGVTSPLTTLTSISHGAILNCSITAIEVDGVILVDNGNPLVAAYDNTLSQTWAEWNNVAPSLSQNNSAHVALFNAINTGFTAYPTDRQTFIDALRTKIIGLTLTTPELEVLCGTAKTLVKRHVITIANNKFYIDGVLQATLSLKKGTTYIFDQDEATNSGHTLKLYTDANKTTEYTSGVTVIGTPGGATSRTTFVVPSNAPAVLYYQSTAAASMGGQLNIS